jgi:hypothetical protein
MDKVNCINIRKGSVGQYWCKENHDMLHCDDNCPFRNYSIKESNKDNIIPHNIYKD